MYLRPRRVNELGIETQCVHEFRAVLQIRGAQSAIKKVLFEACPGVFRQLAKEIAFDCLFAYCLVMIHRRNISTSR
jgi:hypothetical protein